MTHHSSKFEAKNQQHTLGTLGGAPAVGARGVPPSERGPGERSGDRGFAAERADSCCRAPPGRALPVCVCERVCVSELRLGVHYLCGCFVCVGAVYTDQGRHREVLLPVA
eukprot:1160117-Pelagomonas_calceolata.AAC.8